jgi:tetratricopeptide (TPR) repeat protein
MLGFPACAASRGASLYRAGSRALAQGDSVRAIADLEAANALLPGRSEILNHLGIAYDKAGRSAEALTAFEQAVAFDCRNAAAESNLVAARQRAITTGTSSGSSTDPAAASNALLEPGPDPHAPEDHTTRGEPAAQ